jgi:leucyl-tRNA synthetase
MIAPIVPHLAEELYEHGKHTKASVFKELWTADVSFDDAALISDHIS